MSGVTEEIVKRFFDDSSFVKRAPVLELDEDTGKNVQHIHPMTYALPTEVEIGKVVRGELKQSGAYALTLPEVLDKFLRKTNNKRGVEEKVREVIARKCEVVDDPNYHQCLRWK